MRCAILPRRAGSVPRRRRCRGAALPSTSLLEGEFGPPAAALDIAYGRIGDPDPAWISWLRRRRSPARQTSSTGRSPSPACGATPMSTAPTGGFDAVIGNPPWDRLKMQEVEWFAARRRAIAKAARASDRAAMIRRAADDGDPLAADFGHAARWRAWPRGWPGSIPTRAGSFRCSAAATSTSTRCSSSGPRG